MSKTIQHIDFLAPIQTVSEMNQREHWRIRYERKKSQQQELAVAWNQNLKGRAIELPCTVKLTRIAPKKLDVDNLAGAMKFCQDYVAFRLGCDDGDESRVTWIYDQVPIGTHDYAVKISITSLTNGASRS